MGCILIVAALLGLLAFRYPIINHLAGWLIVFPLVTVSAGSLAWAVLIQLWDQVFSLRGYGATLIVFSVPVALWVVRLNR
jgi:hypothetical protein